MTHEKPFIRPCTADKPATLVWSAREYTIPPDEALLWIRTMIEDLQSHRIIVVPSAAEEVRDE